MTPPAHSDFAARVDGPAAQLPDTVASLEWVRRQLHTAKSPHSALLDEILEGAANSPNGPDTLTHPWTTSWVEVAIRLIDRDALVILPHGQVAAHFGQALNLLAALRIGRAPAQIRFDRDGVAWLPGTGACAEGSRSIAGRVATLTPTEPFQANARDHPVRWPEIASAVLIEGVDAQLREADSHDAPAGSADSDEGAPPSEVADSDRVSDEARALIAAWPGQIRRHPPTPLDEPPPGKLAALLKAQHIPIDAAPNTLASKSIRLDSSFDHLSLLSIRSPDDFDRIARAAASGTGPLSRRIEAHVSYIERRYTDAAETYAALLARRPGDTDLWRDACWALRHGGHEELVQTWVLRPALVVQVAIEVDWQNNHGAESPSSGGACLGGLVRYLEWIRDAVRTR